MSRNADSVAFTIFALLSLFVFSPFFLAGAILVGSTDSFTVKLPLIFAGRDDFWNGAIALWDRYSNSGSSISFCSTCPAVINPENWLYFLLPQKWTASLMTAVYAIKFGLVGAFAYLLLLEEVKSRRWALFGALVLMLSGRTLWSLTTHENLTGLLAVTISLYVFWSANRRPPWKTFLFLVGTLGFVVVGPTVNGAAYWFLTIALFFIYRIFSQRQKKDRWLLLLLALTAGLPIAAGFLARVLPIVTDMTDLGGTVPSKLPTPGNLYDLSIFMMRLLVPEILGVNYQTSRDLFLNARIPMGTIDGYSRDFFGIVPLVLGALLLLLRSPRFHPRLLFLALSSFIAVGFNYYLEPFENMARMLLGASYHPSSIDTLMTFPIVFLVAHAGVLLSRKGRTRLSPNWLSVLFLAACFAWLYMSIFWLASASFLGHSEVARFGTAYSLAIGLLIGVVYVKFNSQIKKIWWLLPTLIASVCFVIVLSRIPGIMSIWPKPDHFTTLGLSWVGFGAIVIAIVHFQPSGRRVPPVAAIVVLFLISLEILLLMIPWRRDVGVDFGIDLGLGLAIIGAAKFISVLVIVVNLVIRFLSGQISARLLWILTMGLFLAEQLPALKVHSFRVLNPFSFADKQLYPPIAPLADGSDIKDLNLKDYRMVGKNNSIAIPLARQLYSTGEPLTNLGVPYKLPTPSGIHQDMSRYYLRLGKTLVPDAVLGGRWIDQIGPSDEFLRERFLDLTGVRYAVTNDAPGVLERPTALARFTAFPAWVSLDEPESLTALANPEFPPGKLAIVTVSAQIPRFSVSSFQPPFGVDALADPNRSWHSDNSEALPQWIEIAYDTPRPVNTISISAQAASSTGNEELRAPKNFVLQGSLDGERWVDMVQMVDWVYPKNREPRRKQFNNNESFQFYRLLILANNSGGSQITVNQLSLSYEIDSSTTRDLATSVALPYNQLPGDKVEVPLDLEQHTLILFNDTFHPGWLAEIDGRSVPVLRANAAFMGVLAPPGAKQLRFMFEPRWKRAVHHSLIIMTGLFVFSAALWIFLTKRGVFVGVRHSVDYSMRSSPQARLVLLAVVLCITALGLAQVFFIPFN